MRRPIIRLAAIFVLASAASHAGSPDLKVRPTSLRAPRALLAPLAPLAYSQPPAPRPFPQPGQPGSPPRPSPAEQKKPAPPVPAEPAADAVPTEAALGLPVYPGARFIASYDAGRNQRFYLFGSNVSFAELVAYYRLTLKDKGSVVFEAPATHMFEVGRFREADMAFPPGVTIKDFTWRGSEGYPNPTPGGQPAHFRTIIQVVPRPPGAPPR